MKNFPTMLTIARMALGPVIAALVLWAASVLYSDRLAAALIYGAATLLFILAALSDWVDGYLARKLGAVSPMGAALDHCADKVLLACALVALAYAALPRDLVAAAVLLLAREVAVSGLREGLSNSGRALPVSRLGKWKAAAEMAGVATFLIYQTVALFSAAPRLVIGLDWAAHALIWLAVALALVSGAGYAAAAARKG